MWSVSHCVKNRLNAIKYKFEYKFGWEHPKEKELFSFFLSYSFIDRRQNFNILPSKISKTSLKNFCKAKFVWERLSNLQKAGDEKKTAIGIEKHVHILNIEWNLSSFWIRQTMSSVDLKESCPSQAYVDHASLFT
jgi:hypothetical protein